MGSAAQRAAPPFGITMLRAAKPPLRRGFACGKTLVRSTRAAGQKAGGVQFCLLVRNFKISKLSGYDTKRDICFADVLFCGFRRPQGGSTLRDFNAQGGRAAPAPRFCLGQNARTAHPRRRPEGRLVVLLQRSRPSKISILTVPSTKKASAKQMLFCGLRRPSPR